MPAIRLPIQHDVKTRNNTTDKDSTTINGFVEQSESGTLYTIKRPGISLSASGTGVANGTFFYNDKVYSWDNATTNTSPNIFPVNYLNGKAYFASFWSSSIQYEPDSYPVVLEDPYDNEPTIFYPKGTILAYPDTTVSPTKDPSKTDPSKAGHIPWGITPYVPSVSDSALAAEAAASAFISSLNLSEYLPRSFGPSYVGYGTPASVTSPGTLNPPYVFPNAYVASIHIYYREVAMEPITNLVKLFVPFYF